MKVKIPHCCLLLVCGFTLARACGFDDALREYLNVHFWLPFTKRARDLTKANVPRLSVPFAGMTNISAGTPLAALRAAYQEISNGDGSRYDGAKLQRALSATRAAPGLTPREREEVELLDAKIDLRAGATDFRQPLNSAKNKLQQFLRKAHTPEYLSEARGWLGHAHYMLGERTNAAKIYLDEMHRADSNLSRETLLDSLRMTCGYDGGEEMLQHLEEYFDTAEHAAFAIQLVTNPHWDRDRERYGEPDPNAERPIPYPRITGLLQQHRELFRSESGAGTLALLGMRTAMRAGDPSSALRIADAVPRASATRRDPDFNWMLASAHFVSRNYAAARQPLLRLFRSGSVSDIPAMDKHRAAAAYGLCGVSRKLGNRVEQIRYSLWLRTQIPARISLYATHADLMEDQSVYWAMSGWDLSLLLDAEAPVDALRAFIRTYPGVPDLRVVKYSLAVRLARENRYDEAAGIYQEIGAAARASRMRQLATLYRDAYRNDGTPLQLQEAKYKLAEYIGMNPERLYFNDVLWSGHQRYALQASKDTGLTRRERQKQIADERRLQDDQEERWRAFLLLRDVVSESGPTEVGRRAAQLAIRFLRGIHGERFGRESEILAADVRLSTWLRRSASATVKNARKDVH